MPVTALGRVLAVHTAGRGHAACRPGQPPADLVDLQDSGKGLTSPAWALDPALAAIRWGFLDNAAREALTLRPLEHLSICVGASWQWP